MLLVIAPCSLRSQQVFRLDENCRAVCPVCQGSEESNDTVGLFHALHSDSIYPYHDVLHNELTKAMDSRLFDGRDTLRFYAQMMLARVQSSLKLSEASNRTYSAILGEWESPPVSMNLIQVQIANNHINQGQYMSALDILKKILRTTDFQETPYLEDAVLVATGLCFQNIQPSQTDSAIAYFQKAALIQQADGDSVDLAKTYLNLGAIQFENYNDREALDYWTKSLKLAEAHKVLDILDDLHYNLAQLHEEQGNTSAAIGHLKAYLNYQDSIWNRDRLWELAEQKRQFEVRLKNEEIRSLEVDRALQDAELNEKRAERNTLIGVSASLLLLLGVLVWFYAVARRKNRIIRKQKQRLDELNAAKDQLFSIVAHDLRSPVQAIGRNNQLLQEGWEEDNKSEWKQLLKKNQQGIDRTYRLLDNLLHWAMNQAGLLHLQLDKVKLHSMIEQVHYDFKPMFNERHIVFENNIPTDCLVKADMQTIKVVLRNLLDNALRFTPKGGHITIDHETADDGWVVFSVNDSGPGVPPEHATGIFDIPSAKEKRKDSFGKVSSGLGLHLCSELLKRNGGRILLKSERQKGATFIIQLQSP